jgi:hypothetical protein
MMRFRHPSYLCVDLDSGDLWMLLNPDGMAGLKPKSGDPSGARRLRSC